LGPHFMEAACHEDRSISKKAVQCIHDSMVALLNEQIELPHFHFNEALFKPFENLLCLELCDNDVQDQVSDCLCEARSHAYHNLTCKFSVDCQLHLRIRRDESHRNSFRLASALRRTPSSVGRQFGFRGVGALARSLQGLPLDRQYAGLR